MSNNITNDVNGDLTEAEQKIGYYFNDRNLLERCFTHKSLSEKGSNDRLEFLGDSILGFAVSEKLCGDYPNEDEGYLTGEKICFVSKGALAKAARNLNLNEFVRVGGGESKDKWDEKSISNIFEAVVGGIYLDGGLQPAKDFIFKNIVRVEPEANAKDALVKYIDKNKSGSYEFKDICGGDDADGFTVQFILNGECLSEGKGRNKKLAQAEAAAGALKILKQKEQ